MAKVYALVCDVNGNAYVGCTAAKLGKRMREHRCLLRNGKHAEKALQDDWVKYGEPQFRMIVLEELPPDCPVIVKRQAELKWMDVHDAIGKLYNRNRTAFQGPEGSMAKAVEASRGTTGRRWTAETNLKRRLAQLGKPKGHGAKISATKRAQREMR